MQGFLERDKALLWISNHEMVKIEAWGQDSLRVRATVEAEVREDIPGALLMPKPMESSIEISGGHGSIRNGAIVAHIQVETDSSSDDPVAVIRFVNALSGLELVSEVSPYFTRPPARLFKSSDGNLYHCEVLFKAYDGERFYGLGQHQNGSLNQKGLVIDLRQDNTEVCIPFLLSSRGYGFLWNNPAVGRVELGHDRTRWVAEATRQLDYWITTANSPSGIMGHYADATGHAPSFPEWASGFWQSKLRYATQGELLNIAHEYKERGLPISVIVADFFHWTRQGEWEFDPVSWPDPEGMVLELKEMGIRLMVSIWPTVSPKSSNFNEMRLRGLLVRTDHGIQAHRAFRDSSEDFIYVHYYDPTHPEARHFIWEQVLKGYYQHGIRLWWLDSCEPELRPQDPGNLRFHLGNGLEMSNIYPLFHSQAFYEGMKDAGEEEIITLCRSAWAGSQRHAAAVWSGDIPSTFEALRAQVSAGLNIGLSGIPWWTTDIGGFFTNVPNSDYFRELIVRWFEFGAFCPIFRLHGFRMPLNRATWSGGPNEVWSFGDVAYSIIKEILFLRERLRPYIQAQMNVVSEKGHPFMRPLFFDFPEDIPCYDVEDQFMFGSDLMVAPALYEGMRYREIYLPNAPKWRDAWTGEVVQGSTWVRTETPLDRIPLYLRGDVQLPIRQSES